MNLPAPGPIDYTRVFGTGSEAGGPSGGWPEAIEVSQSDALHGLNPLQHLPGIGMIYRAATGETLPATMRVAGAAILGGPLGMIGAGLMSLFEAIVRMGPDTSRPAVAAGMSETGSEAGVQPVTPGTMTGTAYTTLATSTPEFLQTDTPNTAIVQNGAVAYQSAALEWQRSQSVEKGLA